MRQDSRERAEETRRGVYFESRFPALALALALTLDEREAYAASLRAHVSVFAGKQAGISAGAVLRRVMRKTRMKAHTGQDALYGPLSAMPRQARAAWVLARVAGMPPEEAAGITGMPAGKAADIAGMDPAYAEAFKARVVTMMERKELLSDIQFRAGRRRAVSSRAARAAAFAGLLALLFVIGREGYALSRVLGGTGAQGNGVLTMRAADPGFFRKAPENPCEDLPCVNQPLMDALRDVPDAQPIRVSFRFYDPDAMRGVRRQGKTLEDLYEKLYAETLDRGRVNMLAAAAANRYYANYERPFLARQRAFDFKSAYNSVYDAALSLAEGGVYARIAEAHPEVFGSREAFDGFLYSRAFASRAPALVPLLRLEPRIAAGEEAAEPELRSEYEDALFAFFNPGGYAGRAVTDPFPFDPGELRAFFAQREEMGMLLYERNVRACTDALPPGAQVTSDVLEGTDSSLFSATLTKADVLRIAREDGRFFFLGVAAPHDMGLAGRAENELLARARERLFTRHEVYLIDEHYLLYSVNYAAPLNLPQGFIDGVRRKLGVANTQFEMEVQYVYRMRYAHPQTRTGYGILRSLALDGGARYATRESKPFSLMAGY
ncbi:MAG TPA: hypothetical protein VLA21_02555 [Candidatus Limnocylindria bacterium]|nr:hypothetical protein [Candidatus Limnocylindria bacterium]